MRCFIGTLSLTLASGLAAQSAGPASQTWAQFKVAHLKAQGSNCLKDTTGFGLGVGKWFTSRWGTEVDFIDGSLKSQTGNITADEKHLLGSALFSLMPENTRWIPYLRAGVGLTRVDAPYSLSTHTTTRFAYHSGVGVQYFFGDHGIASLEGRSVSVETSTRRIEYQGLLGVGYRWGAKAAPVAPAPVAVPPPVEVSPPAPVIEKPVEAPVAPPPPPPPPPAPEPPKAPEPPPAKIILDEALLHFANNQAVLPPEAVEAIRTVATSLKGYTGTYDLLVTGHTSSVGSKAHNKALSLRRAQAVAEILVAEGISRDRVKSAGMGPDQPIAENKTKEGQAKNRRVEIDVKAVGVEVKRTETTVFDPTATSKPVRKKAAKR
ncbi:MAG: OmpA family protein [Holophaga sp.]